MRVGIFTDGYEPHTSGVTTSIKMLKRALEDMNHTVYIVAVNLDNHKFLYDEKERIIRIPGIKTGIYNTRLTSIYSQKAMKIIRSWNLDVIHSQTEFGVGTFSRIVAKRLKLPVVHTYHTLYEDYVYYVTHGHFDKLGKKLAIGMTKYFCDKTPDELVVPTDKIKSLFIEKYGIERSINVIPTGIDTKIFISTPIMETEIKKIKKKYKIADTDFVIGSIGRIAKEKSLDVELKAIKPLIDEKPNIKVFIIGDGPELNNLKELVKKLGIDKNVIFTGLIDYSLVPTYFNMLNIMISFSKTETQGLTIIEGLAASTPVLCISDDSFKEMVQDGYNGYLFENDAEFRSYVKKLSEDKALYNELAVNAKNSVYRYSKEVFAADILKVYSRAITKNRIKLGK